MKRPRAFKSLHTLVRAGPVRQMLVVEAMLALAQARARQKRESFAQSSQRFGAMRPAQDQPFLPDENPSLTARDRDKALAIGWAVRASARWLPFRTVCLQQAMAAQTMLQRRGLPSVMHFGCFINSAGTMEHHAWLDCGPVKVTGYPLHRAISEISRFVDGRT